LKIHHLLQPPQILLSFWAFKRSPILVEYLKEAQFWLCTKVWKMKLVLVMY
jgi:hypothetical protein